MIPKCNNNLTYELTIVYNAIGYQILKFIVTPFVNVGNACLDEVTQSIWLEMLYKFDKNKYFHILKYDFSLVTTTFDEGSLLFETTHINLG